MAHRKHVRIAQLAAFVMAVPIVLFAFVTGPDAGVAGVPEEDTCSDCHKGPMGQGSVTVTFPGGTSYTPGTRQHLVVMVADPAAVRWGFQLTARLANSPATQAGSFTPGADGYTQLVCAPSNFRMQAFGNVCATNGMALQYIEHTRNGTRVGAASPAAFEFDWMPPAANVGNVTVYVSAIAANGDNALTGDHVYNARYILTPAGTQSVAPSISGVVNGASFQQDVSAGSWIAILGSNLATHTRSWTAADFTGSALPTQLDGVGVKINGKTAYVAYISPTQINVLAPSDSALGTVSVEATNNGATSPSATGHVQTVSPALFLWDGKYVVATRPDFSLVGPPGLFERVNTVPARPGDSIILWGTGFGPTNPVVSPGILPPTNPVANVAAVVTVTIGNLPAAVIGAALAPGNPGLYQIAAQVPASVADGDQPVTVQAAGIQSPIVLLSVKR